MIPTRAVLSFGLVAFVTSVAAAAELEIAAYGGLTLPFYEQSFPIDLRPPERPFPGIEITQDRPLTLNAKSGLVFAGGATLYLGGSFGLEARYDSADVDIGAEPPSYSVRLSSPFPNFRTTLQPSPTVVTLSALHPVSLNLKLRTSGTLRFFLSAGVSYLPDFQLAVSQPLNLSIAGVPLPSGVRLGTLTAVAISRPEDPSTESRFGGNLGFGLQIKMGDHVALVGEGRVFLFPKQVLTWQVTQQSGIVSLPAEVLNALEDGLEPVRFNPAYFHLIGGLAFTF
jgi:hypothetical protein